MKTEIECIRDLAAENGWIEIDHQEHIYMVSFKKDDCRVNVYYSKMTVSTAMNHPKKGRTQLFRRNVSSEGLKAILQNPRAHTGKGYYRKG